MISKELLENALGTSIRYLTDKYDNNLVSYETEDGWKTINIYELVHKVVEWVAKDYGAITTRRVNANEINYWQCIICQGGHINYEATAKTEPEAVFKIGEFILKDFKKDSKDKICLNCKYGLEINICVDRAIMCDKKVSTGELRNTVGINFGCIYWEKKR